MEERWAGREHALPLLRPRPVPLDHAAPQVLGRAAGLADQQQDLPAGGLEHEEVLRRDERENRQRHLRGKRRRKRERRGRTTGAPFFGIRLFAAVAAVGHHGQSTEFRRLLLLKKYPNCHGWRLPVPIAAACDIPLQYG